MTNFSVISLEILKKYRFGTISLLYYLIPGEVNLHVQNQTISVLISKERKLWDHQASRYLPLKCPKFSGGVLCSPGGAFIQMMILGWPWPTLLQGQIYQLRLLYAKNWKQWIFFKLLKSVPKVGRLGELNEYMKQFMKPIGLEWFI